MNPQDEYMAKALEPVVANGGDGSRPFKVLVIGCGPLHTGFGKSRLLDLLQASALVDVEYRQLGELSGERGMDDRWKQIIYDECHNFDTITIDSLGSMVDAIKQFREVPIASKYGCTNKMAHKGSVGRSRAARAERWR